MCLSGRQADWFGGGKPQSQERLDELTSGKGKSAVACLFSYRKVTDNSSVINTRLSPKSIDGIP